MRCLVARWLRTVRPACCGSQLPRGGTTLFSELCQEGWKISPSWLEQSTLDLKITAFISGLKEGGGGRCIPERWWGFFSFSHIGQFNENYCLSLQALSHFQRQLFLLKSVGNDRCSALLQVRPFISTPYQVKIFLLSLLCTRVGHDRTFHQLKPGTP